MSLTARLLGLTSGTRAVTPAPTNSKPPKGGSSSVWYTTPGMPQTPEWDGLTALRNGYQASIYIMQPVRIIATALGSLPFRVGADPAKPGDYDKSASMARLLGPPPGGPNPVTSPRNLWIWSLVQRLVTGRLAWETVTAPGSDTPVALWPLVAPFLKPIPSRPGTPRWFDGYSYELPTGITTFTAGQVFYSWRPSQVDWRQPESALQAANLPASLQIALDRYMWALAKNGLSARKLVVTPEFAEDEERRAWEEQFAAEFTGYDNGGRVMHGYYEDDPNAPATSAAGRTPPIQVVDLAATPADAQVLQILTAVQNDLLRTWRVPLSWMGDSSARTFENASQEARNFWQGPVMETAAEICDDANLMLAPRFGDGNVGWFDFSSVEALKGTSIFAAVAPDTALKAGLIAAEDWRNDVGLPPLPGDAAQVVAEALPAVDDSPGGTSKANFTRATATMFKAGPVDPGAVRDLLAHAYPGSVLGWVADATWVYDPAVPLDEIKMARRPGGRDQSKVDAITTAVRDGQALDPVVLVDTGTGKLVIADGYHRTLAFDRAGKRTIPALIGTVTATSGPWDRDMHDAKKNRTVADPAAAAVLAQVELAVAGARARRGYDPSLLALDDFDGWAEVNENWLERAAAAAGVDGGMRFDPAQPRGPHGKWSKVGGLAHQLEKTGGKRRGAATLDGEQVAAFTGGSAEKHLLTAADGSVRFTPERQALHDKIVADILGSHRPQEHPAYHLMGGGPASGKSTMMAAVAGDLHDAAVINADDIKALLPEYATHDSAGASFTHEESSYLAKQATAEAFRRRVNVTLDGTGDSSAKSLRAKIDAARSAGYTVHGHYVSIPTQMAVDRAEKRAARTGRHVPRTVIEHTHASVSQVLPQVLGAFDTLDVYDNTGKLVPILRAVRGSAPQVLDANRWQAFGDKAKEPASV